MEEEDNLADLSYRIEIVAYFERSSTVCIAVVDEERGKKERNGFSNVVLRST